MLLRLELYFWGPHPLSGDRRRGRCRLVTSSQDGEERCGRQWLAFPIRPRADCQGSGFCRYTWTDPCRLEAALSELTPWEASGIFQQRWHHQLSNFGPLSFYNFYFLLLFAFHWFNSFFFLTAPCSMWDLSSSPRDQTYPCCIGSMQP